MNLQANNTYFYRESIIALKKEQLDGEPLTGISKNCREDYYCERFQK